MPNGQLDLLRARRFGPFFWTQLLGALNDNLFKNAVVILLAFGATADGARADLLVNLAAGLFIAPFCLFSAAAGQLADRLEKTRLIRAIKLAEIALMGLGAVGLLTASPWLLLLVLFLMGTHSTFFGPVKLSILPQHLSEKELVAGNALVQLGTFVAILAGTILGGLLMSLGSGGVAAVAGAGIVTAVAGWLASRRVPPAPAAAPDLRLGWNPLAETRAAIRCAREDRTVFLSILGASWFWFYGALLLAQFPGLGREVLGGDQRLVTLLLVVFAVGAGIGCILCDRLSAGTIELGLVPLGSLGLSLFAVDLCLTASGFARPDTPTGVLGFLRAAGGWRLLVDLALVGVFGGFFVVPLQALVQHRSRPEHCARVIAAGNMLSALFMAGAAAVAIALRAAGLSIPQLILLAAIVNGLVAVYVYTLVPEFLMRLVVWLLMHTVYRVRTRGLAHLPEAGPAVLVCNHVSFVDALVIAAASRRPVRFVMHHSYYRLPILNFVFRIGRAIPIASRRESPALVEAAFDEVERALSAGEIVCMFPEGTLTTTGELGPFRTGVERIVRRTPVPVVPMALRGLWGSFFSRKDGAAMRKRPRRLRSRIELVCGMPVPPEDVTAARLETHILALRGAAC